MKRLIPIILSLSMTAVLYVSCTDSFLETTNQNNVNSESFYQTADDAVASVNSAYAMLQAHGLWGRSIFFLLDFAGEEVGTTANTQGPPLQLLNHTYTSSGNTHITTPWSNLYDMISKANSTILNVSEMEEMDAGLRDRVVAEAHFLRGLGYFYINAIYGGGPLRTADNLDEIHLPRSSAEEIWTQVENDLEAAYQVLPRKGEYSDADVGRATSGAARALLGKAHLYQEEWSEAETQFQAVIDSEVYHLISAEEFGGDPVAAMRSNHAPEVDNNDEAVFEVQFAAGTGFGWETDGTGLNETSIRPQEYGVNGFAFYNAVPATDLIEAYEDDDPRLEAFYFGPNSTYQGEPYPFEEDGWAWKKYQKTDEAEQSESDANMDVIRYADVLLMMAEARIQQGAVADGVDYINQVRRRADPSGAILPDRVTTDPSEAMDFLIHERRVELSGEQTRFFDLVRWGLAAEELGTFQNGKHEVFPVPQEEINANTEISQDDQNPGY
ncbi:Starch-binding associating with outer membrane [Fodinibius roseus]|uniref:Starch-binding associating with outer membrane n=1 Tax=Fodinibius roseus TaxID=1194090 RepID=A0A1M4ZIS3_9BACT|nr:RagB/SusD family nutrient uptake outer membrane protein [Fodinibius roseus]SHF17466.1 Starch-binding associating with outer membrane [Fodinibius roseus]